MINKVVLLFIVVCAFLFGSRDSNALIKFNDAVFPELATSARALAMGNAFLCRVDDSSAVFYNPAGLGTVRYSHMHFSNFHFEGNKGIIDAETGGNSSKPASNIGKSFSLEGMRKLLLENRGSILHSRFHFLPNITTRYFSMGALFSKQTKATIGQEDTALYEWADRLDWGPYAAMNVSLFGGVIKFGGSVVYLNRKEYIDEQDRTLPVDKADTNYKKGWAFVTTAGGRITLPIAFLPTIAGTIHNAAAQKFHKTSDAGAPGPIKQSIDVGFSITPQIGKMIRLHLEANYKDIGGAYSDVKTTRKLVFGAEFDFARKAFFRVGYGDGFGSAGLGVMSKYLEVSLTTYAVDTTANEYRGKEDRRFVMSLSSGW